MDWLIAHWTQLLTLLFGGGGLATLVKIGPKTLRRMVLILDCEADRLRWEESDKLRDHRDRLRDGEIILLRTTVENLQADIQRLQRHYAPSGVGSVTAPPDAATTDDPSPATTTKPKPSAR
jgi:hypothetical protein